MRQFVSEKKLDKNGLLEISGKDFRYFRQVLRFKAGDMVLVRLPDGKLVNMTLCRADDSSKKIVLQLCAQKVQNQKNEDLSECSEQSAESKNDGGLPDSFEADFSEKGTEFYLFMFVPKPSKFDLIVRQATECGILRIFPVRSEFSQAGAEKMNFRSERFERIIKEARQQSGSAVNTTVEECIDVQKLCEIWRSEAQKSNENDYEIFGCVLYERSEFTSSLNYAMENLAPEKKLKKCAVVCGSEGGISPAEIKMLLSAGFKAVHFETNILRCETAALYGTAVLQNAVFERENFLKITKTGEKNETD